jgi:hypothetical protein
MAKTGQPELAVASSSPSSPCSPCSRPSPSTPSGDDTVRKVRASSIGAGLLAATLPCTLGCGASGALGARWGSDAEVTSARLGVPCTRWYAWSDARFEACENLDVEKSVYGMKATLLFYRRGRDLVGLALRFHRTRWVDIRAAALADLPLSRKAAASDAPYEIFADDSLVRVEDDHEGGVTLVLAGPTFGKVYAGYVLGQGLGGLFRVR